METILPLLRQKGLKALSNNQLAAGLHLTEPELHSRYPNREGLMHELLLADLERQKREHTTEFARYETAVEKLFALIQHGMNDMMGTSPEYVAELQEEPATWQAVVDHLATYSTPQLQGLLNDGIRQRLFRSDINIQLVTKIIVEQVNMLLNPQVFPSDRYNMAEVFRSMFLYYIRGLCTEEGARIAANHFSKL